MAPMTMLRRLGIPLALAVALLAGTAVTASAQAPTAPAASAALSKSTISAVQAALAKQGIAVNVDGVLGEDTRAAIRRFQSQHHLPVTGEADKATLDKLGVASEPATTQAPMPRRMGMPAQPAQPGGRGMGTMQGGMMQGGMMQGSMPEQCQAMHQQMQAMMTTMQDMMKSMQGMQPQTPTPPKSN